MVFFRLAAIHCVRLAGKNADLDVFYPTTLLITGFDILFSGLRA